MRGGINSREGCVPRSHAGAVTLSCIKIFRVSYQHVAKHAPEGCENTFRRPVCAVTARMSQPSPSTSNEQALDGFERITEPLCLPSRQDNTVGPAYKKFNLASKP